MSNKTLIAIEYKWRVNEFHIYYDVERINIELNKVYIQTLVYRAYTRDKEMVDPLIQQIIKLFNKQIEDEFQEKMDEIKKKRDQYLKNLANIQQTIKFGYRL